MSTKIEEEDEHLDTHLALLSGSITKQDQHELASTPIFTKPVIQHSRHAFNQYGFLAGASDILDTNSYSGEGESFEDPRVFFNISAPSSAFICGSQGSGKSHTLSCLLENCLLKSNVSKLENPLVSQTTRLLQFVLTLLIGRASLSLRQLLFRRQRHPLRSSSPIVRPKYQGSSIVLAYQFCHHQGKYSIGVLTSLTIYRELMRA